MGLFDVGRSVTSTLSATAGAISTVTSTVNNVSRLASSISNFDVNNFASSLRSINIPAMGEIAGDIMGAIASFEGDQFANDWRVRLSIANWVSFKSSPVLAPLKSAGGLIFPYTPNITIRSAATYSDIVTTHTNYTHRGFKSSDPGNITITAPMNVEDANQALYWIAAVHYLRSLTKMFSGNDAKAGNPPPVIYLNGYGNYVFKNVPVVVESFDVQLTAECDYIGVEVVGSMAGQLEGLAGGIGDISNAVGSLISPLKPITNVVSGIANTAGQLATTLGAFGVGGATSGGITHVPTKSSFTVQLKPIYSRHSSRKFSLDRFVTGGYLDNSVGYI